MNSLHQHPKAVKRPFSVLSRFVISAFIFSLAFFSSGCESFKKKEIDTEQLSAEAIYGGAKKALINEKWADAIEQLGALEARYPYGRFAKQAQLETAFAHYKVGDEGAAIAAAERFLSLNPTHPAVDYAYYIKGLASFNEVPGFKGLLTGRTNLADRDPKSIREAIAAFSTITTHYPNSQYAYDAGKRIAYLQSAQAQHEISIALYYYDQSAYVAAVSRAQSVLANFPQHAQIEDALGILYHSYKKMGMNTLADDSRRVLSLNYPASTYLNSRAKNTKAKGLFSRIRSLRKKSSQ